MKRKQSPNIYKTTNLINGKIYVGQSMFNNESYLGSGKELRKAVKEFGKINFIKEILETCLTKEELNLKERYWIRELNSLNPEIGYNIHRGGQGRDTSDTRLMNDGVKVYYVQLDEVQKLFESRIPIRTSEFDYRKM
jgi:group I intron endonuclease